MYFTAKNFIRRLLNPDPSQRPTASEAYDDPWLTTHAPEGEHDLSAGLRENFNARAKWRSAIASVRALHRFSSMGSWKSLESAGSGKSEDSGGWKDSDDEDGSGVESGDGKDERGGRKRSPREYGATLPKNPAEEE